MTGDRRDRLVDADKQLGEIQRALVDFDSGQRRNIAIIGEPLSGKTALLDTTIARYGKPIRRFDLKSIVSRADDLPAGACPEKITAVDDCQYLFQRRIGGFTVLEKFLETVASSDRLFVTAWNKYAWDYLKQVFAIGDYFPTAIAMPALSTDKIAGVIGARYDLSNVRFVYDEKIDGPLVKVGWRTISTGGLSLDVPYLKPGHGIIGRVLGEDVAEARHLIFEKIAWLSHGNPGVALALWQKAYHDGEIRVSRVSVPDFKTDLAPDEAFVIGNILMMKSATEDDLLKITVGHLKMDRILYALLNRGLIRKAADRYSVEPLAMYGVIKSLKQSRQVW
jgi:hypothetical protein